MSKIKTFLTDFQPECLIKKGLKKKEYIYIYIYI